MIDPNQLTNVTQFKIQCSFDCTNEAAGMIETAGIELPICQEHLDKLQNLVTVLDSDTD
jgi:hypothetical protein